MSLARIRISWPKGAVSATLDDTPTARGLVAALPVKGEGADLGRGSLLRAPVTAKLESGAKQVVRRERSVSGPKASSLALPWGRTPVSEGDESRLVTRCNVLGIVDGDPRRLASVRSGDGITVSLE